MKEGRLKDVLVIGGFASIFHGLGLMILFVFSTGSQLECDRWTDDCTLQHTYAIGESDDFRWRLSETSKAYVSTSYPRGTPKETQGKQPLYRAVIALSSGQMIPWIPGYSSDKEGHESFVTDFSTYIRTDSLMEGDNGRFSRHLNSDFVFWWS